MASRKDASKKVKSTLRKEVNLPIPVPKNKIGDSLSKKRRWPLSKYVAESWAELKKVTWPGRKESLKLTLAVIIFTAVFTVFTAIADLGISNVVERILLTS